MISAPGRPTMIFLMGPTGAGKTDLAVALASRFQVELVSVDSALVYRDMDIGTAKPSKVVRARVPHRLVDICNPEESYSAARFRIDARREINEILGRGKVPLLVGGTGLYFRALERGLAKLPKADQQIRERLAKRARNGGLGALYKQLQCVDFAAAAKIHPNDQQRILRALEVFEISGQPMSVLIADDTHDTLEARIVKIVLAPSERPDFHQALAERFHGMLEAGLVTEVERLLARPGMQKALPSMRLVGYRQIAEYLCGMEDYDVAVTRAITATRRLAKRQLTWLRGEQSSQWFDCQDRDLQRRALKFLRRHSILPV